MKWTWWKRVQLYKWKVHIQTLDVIPIYLLLMFLVNFGFQHHAKIFLSLHISFFHHGHCLVILLSYLFVGNIFIPWIGCSQVVATINCYPFFYKEKKIDDKRVLKGSKMCLSFNSIDLKKTFFCLSKWTCISHLVFAYKKWWPRTNGV